MMLLLRLSLNRTSDKATTFIDCNVTLARRERLSIIGPSGSGKTTLLKACQGLLSLDDGEMQINDRLVTDETQKTISSNIASVRREDSTIAGSIIENITFREPLPDMDNVGACAKLVLFHEDILRHPLAFDRKVYEMDRRAMSENFVGKIAIQKNLTFFLWMKELVISISILRSLSCNGSLLQM